jgi:hypothetical protein
VTEEQRGADAQIRADAKNAIDLLTGVEREHQPRENVGRVIQTSSTITVGKNSPGSLAERKKNLLHEPSLQDLTRDGEERREPHEGESYP